jgi:hypothetical protein
VSGASPAPCTINRCKIRPKSNASRPRRNARARAHTHTHTHTNRRTRGKKHPKGRNFGKEKFSRVSRGSESLRGAANLSWLIARGREEGGYAGGLGFALWGNVGVRRRNLPLHLTGSSRGSSVMIRRLRSCRCRCCCWAENENVDEILVLDAPPGSNLFAPARSSRVSKSSRV